MDELELRYNPVDVQIGVRLHELRTRRGVSREGLALNLGIDLAALDRFEHGLTDYPPQTYFWRAPRWMSHCRS